MFLTFGFIVGILGHLSSGIPLESPSSDFSQFFNQRIVGGTEAPHGSTPHMVSLLVGHTWRSFVCGASIIKKHLVLTAAHCVVLSWNGQLFESFDGMVGSNIWHAGHLIKFQTYWLHPKYNSWTIKYDVAIMRTDKDIPLSQNVAVIALNFDFVGGGEKCVVHGWGTQQFGGSTPNYLQFLELYTLDPQVCVDLVREATGNQLYVNTAIEVCTLHSPGHGLCHGDSGSALVLANDGTQHGVVSWTSGACARGSPDVYVRLFGVKDFVLEIMFPTPNLKNQDLKLINQDNSV